MRKPKFIVATIFAVVLWVFYLDAQASKTTDRSTATSVNAEIRADPEKIRAM